MSALLMCVMAIVFCVPAFAVDTATTEQTEPVVFKSNTLPDWFPEDAPAPDPHGEIVTVYWYVDENGNKEIRRVQIDAQRRIESTEYEAAKDIEHLEKALAAEQKESALQRGLNANLLRIARERANADRKLKPKKEHTGYVVVSSMEKEHRYKDGNGRWHTVVLWETVLETPYTVDFCVEEVRHLIQELFQDDEDGNWPIEKIGITGDYPKGYANMIYDKDWREEYRNYNVMLERRLKANYRTGFWEMIFLHTKPLAAVPSDMRAGRN